MILFYRAPLTLIDQKTYPPFWVNIRACALQPATSATSSSSTASFLLSEGQGCKSPDKIFLIQYRCWIKIVLNYVFFDLYNEIFCGTKTNFYVMHTCIIICILIFLLIYTFLNSRCRNVRKADRDLNKDSYPFLNFPEIYVMHNGFKDFYETHQVNSVVKLSKTYFCQNNGLDILLCRFYI